MSVRVPPGFEVVHEGEHFCVAENAQRKIVVAIRKPGTTMGADGLATAFEGMHSAIRPEHADFGLVVDTRAARGNNDADFEAQVQRVVADLSQHFARMVSLVATTVGKLQAQRLNASRDASTRVHATNDEAEAYAVAAGERPIG